MLQIRSQLSTLLVAIIQLNKDLEEVYNYMTTLSSNVLSPSVISPVDLRQVLIKVTQNPMGHPKLGLPSKYKGKGIWEYYRLLKIKCLANRYNVWFRQPLLAAKLFDMECDEIDYRANMNRDGNNISVGFQPVPPQLIDINSCQVEVGPIQPDSPKIEKPEFGPRPDTNSTEFNFEKELD